MDLDYIHANQEHLQKLFDNHEIKFFRITGRVPHLKFSGNILSNITEDDMLNWTTKYPHINIKDELQRATDWMIKNPNVVTHIDTFIEKWLERSDKNFINNAR